MVEASIKPEARKLVEQLPEDSTWDDLMAAIAVRLAVDAGISDFKAGRTMSHEEVLRRFDISE